MEAGGLPRTDYPGFADEFAQLIAEVNGDERAAERASTGADSSDRAGVREGAE